MLRLALSLLSTSAAAYTLSFQTDVAAGAPRGLVVINVTAAWAPLGAAHLHELVEDDFYDGAALRVVPNFVLQFGIAGTPAENEKWQTPIKDDPVLQSNLAGTITLSLIHI